MDEELLKSIEEYGIKKKKEKELEEIFYWEHVDGESFCIVVDGEFYKFSMDCLDFIFDLKDKGEFFKNKEGYLSFKYERDNRPIDIHNFLKREEVEKLAEKWGCPTIDIHVHHKNKDFCDNSLDNLEVLHKDRHALRHGFNAWGIFQRYRKARRLVSFYIKDRGWKKKQAPLPS